MSNMRSPVNGGRYGHTLWLAISLALLAREGLPWAISLLTSRYGWTESRPSIWNLLGLFPVLISTIGPLWGVAVHAAPSQRGIEWELDKSHVLTRGMYAFSHYPTSLHQLCCVYREGRHPILARLTLRTIFPASVPIRER